MSTLDFAIGAGYPARWPPALACAVPSGRVGPALEDYHQHDADAYQYGTQEEHQHSQCVDEVCRLKGRLVVFNGVDEVPCEVEPGVVLVLAGIVLEQGAQPRR